MRIAYIKNGNGADQCRRLLPNLSEAITSGIDAFIYDFLAAHPTDQILVLSRFSAADKYQAGQVTARTYDGSGKRRFSAALAILKSILQFKPDRIICGASGELLGLSYVAARLLRVPLVHSRHNLIAATQGSEKSQWLARIDHYVIPRIQGVVCHGPYLREQILELCGSDRGIHEFDVGFEVEQLSTALRPFDLNQATLLYIGRIERRKGAFDLLEAFRATLASHPDWRLIYLGDGSALTELRETVNAMGLDERVSIPGRVSHADVLKQLNGAQLVICPSRLEFPEGRCMAAMEALLKGIPVIAPDYGPFPYLVKHEQNGLLYTPDSISALNAAITSALAAESTYQQLCAGARRTGKELLTPIRTFNAALELAFNDSRQPGNDS